MKNCERLYPRKEYTRGSISHVRKVLKEIYNIEMPENDYGYKSNRYRRFNDYRLVNADTGEIIAPKVTLSAVTDMLKRNNEY